MSYSEILKEIERLLRKSILNCLNFLHFNLKMKDIYTYVIYITDDLYSLGWAANTISNCKGKSNFDKWYYAGFAVGTGLVDEEFESIFNENIYNLLRQLEGNYFEFDDDDETNYKKVKKDLVHVIISAILNVKKEISFDCNNITFFITMVDNDEAESLENYSAKLLNDSIMYGNFVNRFS